MCSFLCCAMCSFLACVMYILSACVMCIFSARVVGRCLASFSCSVLGVLMCSRPAFVVRSFLVCAVCAVFSACVFYSFS